MTLPADPTRARDLKLIHAAARQMGWDEDLYRAMLARITGQTSAATLSARQRKKVLDEFARLGWNPKTAPSHRHPNHTPRHKTPSPHAGEGRGEGGFPLTGPGWGKSRLIAKIGALLADAGRGWAYADGCARKMFQVDSVRFCDDDQLRRIVAALSYDQQRRAKRAPQATPPDAA